MDANQITDTHLDVEKIKRFQLLSAATGSSVNPANSSNNLTKSSSPAAIASNPDTIAGNLATGQGN